MSYDKWRARLAGEKVQTFTQPDHEDEGYYRIPITEKAPNGSGRNIVKGWIPICYFMYEGVLTGNIGDVEQNRSMTDDEVIDRWTWCCGNPIPYEWYQAVAENGEPWPDSAEGQLNRAMGADAISQAALANALEGKRTDSNQPPPPAEDEIPLPPEQAHAKAIDDAIAATVKKIETDADAELALGARNRIAELRLAADKAGKALYEPPFREYKRLYALWNPPVARAAAEEKAINARILTYRDGVRERIAAEAAAAQKRLEEEAEANARAADRAIARGEPEPEPEVAEPEPPPVAVAPLQPAYGRRTIKEEVKTFLDTVTDWEALYRHFAANGEVKAILLKLAAAEIKAGRTVPGTTTREGLI